MKPQEIEECVEKTTSRGLKDGGELSARQIQLGKGLSRNRRRWSDLPSRRVFTQLCNPKKVLQVTAELPTESPRGVLGVQNDGWESAWKADGRESYELPKHGQ